MRSPADPGEGGVEPGSSPQRIRRANLVAALRCLHDGGPLSRAELARRLRLNRSSSGQIIAELTRRGLVREVAGDPPPAGRSRAAGRPGILLELVADAAFFLGIEIGVEHVACVTIDLAAAVRTQRHHAYGTPAVPVAEAVAHALATAFAALAPGMAERCRGVGVAAPMHLRGDGRVSLAPLIGWRDVDLAGLVRAALPVPAPVLIENDANAFAIGHGYRQGRAGVILFLLMETGVGGGILIDGRLFRGGHGLAGEIGHMKVPGSGGIALEQLIGRAALLTRWRAATGRDAGFPDLLRAVAEREPEAVAIGEAWARHLAYTLDQACRMLDPDRIVLGGSVAALYPLVAARVAAHLGTGEAVAFPAPRIVVDDDPLHGAAFGAACLLHERFLALADDLPAGPPATVPHHERAA